jgi:hypothetical protein
MGNGLLRKYAVRQILGSNGSGEVSGGQLIPAILTWKIAI